MKKYRAVLNRTLYLAVAAMIASIILATAGVAERFHVPPLLPWLPAIAALPVLIVCLELLFALDVDEARARATATEDDYAWAYELEAKAARR